MTRAVAHTIVASSFAINARAMGLPLQRFRDLFDGRDGAPIGQPVLRRERDESLLREALTVRCESYDWPWRRAESLQPKRVASEPTLATQWFDNDPRRGA
jgi:hypothetical protein